KPRQPPDFVDPARTLVFTFMIYSFSCGYPCLLHGRVFTVENISPTLARRDICRHTVPPAVPRHIRLWYPGRRGALSYWPAEGRAVQKARVSNKNELPDCIGLPLCERYVHNVGYDLWLCEGIHGRSERRGTGSGIDGCRRSQCLP